MNIVKLFKKDYQNQVNNWVLACFGHDSVADIKERSHRFIEEALELVQATGVSEAEAYELVKYVYSRNIGEVRQEVGGVMITLHALCSACFVDAIEAGRDELNRVWKKIDVIREKQNNKPKSSALPQTWVDQDKLRIAELERQRDDLHKTNNEYRARYQKAETELSTLKTISNV